MKMRNPMILVPLFAAAAAVVYLMLVRPASEEFSKERAAAQKLREEVSKRQIDIQSRSVVEERTKQVDAALASFAELQLEPLLESYAMQAKALVGEMAAAAGLVDAEFSERPVLALPVRTGQTLPAALHSRQPVLVSCFGDYAAIVSFILRVERDLPHVSLGGLKIVPGGASPDLQRAEIVLEWPVKGAVGK